MPFFRILFVTVLMQSLTACLTVTGEAKDQFDLEDEEDSLNLVSTFKPFGSDDQPNTPAPNTDTLATDAVEGAGENPTLDTSTIDPKEFADFQKWKKERNSNSAEYQEFLEYQEYKRWLEFQKQNAQ